ncbi:VIT1/CCC1 transporter family protein [Luteococcus sp. Sow4_B9]|uniref:VIT1/CCC1 transporter family protein n=1 Tax=Luteococcus sp. Sow4_B9 TaxID=3438792 RepID=UPI003F9D63E9
MTTSGKDTATLHAEGNVGDRLNWLRAAVLGANDGIVSMAGLLIGVAGASASSRTLLMAGVAGISSGAMSMAVGEYVSVSAQSDSEKSMLAMERRELRELPEQERDEMVSMLEGLGVSSATARTAADEIHAGDAFDAHAQLELGIDPDATSSPFEAAWASCLAFTTGGLVPMLGVLLAPEGLVIPVVMTLVVVALMMTGALSARLGKAPVAPAMIRLVLGGLLAMAITFGIGRLFGATLA